MSAGSSGAENGRGESRPAIAVDAMGGDHAPGEIVRGAVNAVREHPDLIVHLVGREDEVRAALAEAGYPGDANASEGTIRVVAAKDVVGMGESPVTALRQKKDSSILRALKLVRSGDASAFVSAGNTGACVAASTLALRTLPEVKKAGIAVAFYVGSQPVVLLDAGANVEARPDHLLQYGVMGSLYASEILGIENPRVGLLNVGEEDAKGHRLAKETNELFQASTLNFYGNVEGREMYRGVCDVVVCDGFTGNVVLKVSEGIAEQLLRMFKDGLKDLFGELAGMATSPDGGSGESAHPLLETGRGLIKKTLLGMQERLDYAEFGGAPLLGLNGSVIIAHGRSDARAISNAIRAARRMTAVDIGGRIVENVRVVENIREMESDSGSTEREEEPDSERAASAGRGGNLGGRRE